MTKRERTLVGKALAKLDAMEHPYRHYVRGARRLLRDALERKKKASIVVQTEPPRGRVVYVPVPVPDPRMRR